VLSGGLCVVRILSGCCHRVVKVLFKINDVIHRKDRLAWHPVVSVLSGCQGVVRVLSGCCQGAVRVLSGCYQGVIRVLSG